MTAAARARCPTCKNSVDTRPETRPKSYPFCCQRCRLLDLHRWLSGEYSIPVENALPEADEA